MPFNVDAARADGISDNEIINHLKSQNPSFNFESAINDGISLNEIADHLTKKEGEQNEVNKQNQPEAQLDNNEQRQGDQQVQPSVEQGTQPSEVQLRKPQGEEQRVGNIDTNLKIDAPFQIGGENIAKETQQAQEGSQGQEAGKGIRFQDAARNQAQVSGAAISVPSAMAKKPSEPEEGNLLDLATRGVAKGVYEFGEAAASMAAAGANPLVNIAKNAEWLFGKNKFSDEVFQKGQDNIDLFKNLSKSMDINETENKSLLDSLVFTTFKMVPDLLAASLTGGESAIASGAKAAEGIIKPIVDKAIHGMVAFAAPSIKSAELAINKSKEDGGSDVDALTEGMKTLVETEIGAALPMNVSSGLKNMVARGASRFLQAYPLSVAQQEIGITLNNLLAKEGQRQPTLTENIIEGNFDAAGKQLVEATPMALLGVLGENTNKIKRQLEENSLILTFNEFIKPTPKKVQYSSEAQLLKDTTLRLNQLKAKPAEELTTEEANELEFLRGVPTTEELAAGYGVTVRKPTYSSKEIIESNLNDATTELASLTKKEATSPLNSRETKRKTKLESDIAKNQELLDSGKTLEDETARKEAEKTKKPEEVTQPEQPKQEEETATVSDSSEEIESIYKTAEEALKRGDRDTAVMSLNAAKEAEAAPENATSKEGQEARKQRWNAIDAALEGIQIKPTEKKSVEPIKQNEEQVQETSRVSTEQGKPLVETPTVKTEEGATQWQGEGQEEVVVPKTIQLAKSVDEAKAWGKQQVARLSKLTSASAQRERVRTEAKVNQRIAELDGSNKPVVVPKTIQLAKSVEEARAWGEEKISKLSTLKSISAKREIERTQAQVNQRVAQLEKSRLDNGKPRAVPKKEKPLPKKPKGTRVLAAAYKRPSDGKMFYGSNHKEALLASGMSWKDVQSKYGNPSQRESPEFGYKTDTNDFVSRREAEQVGAASKQIDAAGLAADKQLGLDLHSNRIALDEFPAFKAPEFSMGAARPSEFSDKKAFNATLVKGTQAHESIKGEVTFDKWKSAFLTGLKKGGQFTESQLKSIFQESEGLNAYAKSFGRKPEDIIDFPELWSGKSASEIEALAKSKRPEDIDLTNKNIDELRQGLGYDPIMKEEAEKWGDVWKEAMLRINSNIAEIPSLIAQLRNRPRALTPVEKATLRYATLDALHTLDNKTRLLASATDRVERKKYNQEYDQASRDLNELLEIESRTASASGLSLNAVKLINRANGNVTSMINQYRAAKNTYNKGEGRTERELSQKELTKIRDQSKALVDALKARDEALQEAKILEADKSISDFLKTAKKDRKSGEAITDLSVDEQITQYTMEIESSGDDTMNVGVAMRGLARAISEKLNTTDVAVVSKEVNARIKDMMGKEWNENTTKDALAGNGIFGQHTERGAKGSLRVLARKTSDFEKDLAGVMKTKNPKERDLKMAKLLERNRVDVKELEPQIADQTETMITRISKLIGELKNNELRPCE
jgi:hypothetical protein